MSRRAVAGLLALLAVTTLVPQAVAQTVGETSVDMSLPNLGAPVRPANPQNNSVTVRYQWNNGITTEPTTIRLEVVEEPPWLNSTFTPSTIQINNTTRAPSGNEASIVTVTLAVATNAPAYADARALYQVVAEDNGPLQQAEATHEFPITAGFRGTVDVSLPMGDNVTAWGGLLTEIPIRLENNANGPLLVDVTVPRSPADAQFTAPKGVLVNATANDTVTTTHLGVRVPWSVSESGPVVVELSPTHATRGTPARNVEARFQLNGNSAVPVPGPSPWLVLAGVGLIAMARRRLGT